jgi:uncharacterized SAM-dependent methyltransferase
MIAYLSDTLPHLLPGLRMAGHTGEYFEALAEIARHSKRRKVLLFLGSNIGNMTQQESRDFCIELRSFLNKGDMVLLGIDLKKAPKTILAAYNDEAGVTRRFNLNLLARINRELGGDFNLEKFEHFPIYNPHSGECRSYLISTEDQIVTIGNTEINFEMHEPIDMEVSQKFTITQTERLAKATGFECHINFLDEKQYFLDTIWIAR